MSILCFVKEALDLEIKGNAIYLNQANSANLTISVFFEDGTERPFKSGDTVYFSVKKEAKDNTYVFQKKIVVSDGREVQVEIDPSDTAFVPQGSYVYDVQLNTSTGELYTLIQPSVFKILGRVTDEL